MVNNLEETGVYKSANKCMHIWKYFTYTIKNIGYAYNAYMHNLYITAT